MLDSLDRHLQQNRYDIVHAMLPVRKCDLYHPHAGCSEQALEKMDWLKRLMNPRREAMATVESDLLLSDQRTQVLCLSDYVRNTFRDEYPDPRVQSRLQLLFNGIDLARFQRSWRRPRRDPRTAQSPRRRNHRPHDRKRFRPQRPARSDPGHAHCERSKPGAGRCRQTGFRGLSTQSAEIAAHA